MRCGVMKGGDAGVIASPSSNSIFASAHPFDCVRNPSTLSPQNRPWALTGAISGERSLGLLGSDMVELRIRTFEALQKNFDHLKAFRWRLF